MIILDTCVIIWAALTPASLSHAATAALVKHRATGEIGISEISFLEIAMLVSKGRLNIGTDYLSFMNLVMRANAYRTFGITPEIADALVKLPRSAGFDPADRIIAATAISQNAKLVTPDGKLSACKEVGVIW